MSREIVLNEIQEGCYAYLNTESVEVLEQYNHYIWLVRLIEKKYIVMALESDLYYPHIYE